jgi:hypothetical protein
MYFASTPAAVSVWRKVRADLLVAARAAELEEAVDVTVALNRTASGATFVVPTPVTLTIRTVVEGFWWIAIASTERVRIAKNIPRKIFIHHLPTPP